MQDQVIFSFFTMITNSVWNSDYLDEYLGSDSHKARVLKVAPKFWYKYSINLAEYSLSFDFWAGF